MPPTPKSTRPPAPPRRHWLRRSLQLGTAAACAPLLLLRAPLAAARSTSSSGAREIALQHLHTRESIATVYAVGSEFIPAALGSLDYFLRDHYNHEVGRMDPQLYELMQRLRLELGSRNAFEVISGFRSAATNERLRTTRGGGVAKRSLHQAGQAIDVRLPGVPLADLRDAALALKAGGVGYYPGANFVHIDTGPLRRW